jgi:hypothetical protein
MAKISTSSLQEETTLFVGERPSIGSSGRCPAAEIIKEKRKMEKEEKLPTDVPVIYAFVIKSSPSNSSLFSHSVVMMDSEETIKEKIRANVQSQARVEIIEPERWNPPEVTSATQEAVSAKWMDIISRVYAFFLEHGRDDVSRQQLVAEGGAWPRSKSGRVFCIFEIGPR